MATIIIEKGLVFSTETGKVWKVDLAESPATVEVFADQTAYDAENSIGMLELNELKEVYGMVTKFIENSN